MQRKLSKIRKKTMAFMWCVDESWFYHKQIGRKSSNAAWVAKGDPLPTVVRPNKFAPRTLFSIFFKSTGPAIIHRIERGETVDHWYYIDNCLQPLVNEIKRQRPSLGTRAIQLLHSNGRSHVHKAVCDYLESEDIRTMQNHCMML